MSQESSSGWPPENHVRVVGPGKDLEHLQEGPGKQHSVLRPLLLCSE